MMHFQPINEQECMNAEYIMIIDCQNFQNGSATQGTNSVRIYGPLLISSHKTYEPCSHVPCAYPVSTITNNTMTITTQRQPKHKFGKL